MGMTLKLDAPSMVPGGTRKVGFPAASMDLAEELGRLLVEKGFVASRSSLEELHRFVNPEDQQVDEHGLNNVTKSFYQTSPNFLDRFRQVVVHAAMEVFDFDFLFQATPTVRFHFQGPMPDAYRSPEGDYLGQHNDGMLGHSHEEINIWLPLTSCSASAALQLAELPESIALLKEFAAEFGADHDTYHRAGRKLFVERMMRDLDFRARAVSACKPRPMRYGEMLVFDSRSLHATAENREPMTRISIDFRIIPVDRYDAIKMVYRSQGRSGRNFTRGDVFESRSGRELARELAPVGHS